METIAIERIAGAPVVLQTTGSVQDVIHGQTPDQGDWIDISLLPAGFEAGSPKSLESIGEMIALKGRVYVRSTEGSIPTVITGTRLISNGAAFLPKEAEPGWRVTVHGTHSLAEVYEEISHVVKGPFFTVGLLDFSHARVTAISHPPIHGQNIFEHPQVYYANGEWACANTRLAIVGCAANLQSSLPAAMLRGLSSVLYHNPSAKAGVLTTHTHALETKENLPALNAITSSNAKDVFHLFDDSEVKSGTLDVYLIEGTESLTPQRQ